MLIKFLLNGKPFQADVAPNEYLLQTLRAHHVTSVKNGCDESSCGACTVLLDGKPVLACSLLSLRVEGHAITTVEGIPEEISKLSDLFSDEGADQCGFCNTGLALAVYALKHELKNPSDEEIKQYLVGNLCRCSGYQAQFKAIVRYVRDTQ